MDITLLHPWVLILFLIYPILLYILSHFGKKRVFANVAILKRVSSKSISIEKILYPLILLLLLLTLSYPIKKSNIKVSIRSSQDILLLLDASASMRDDNRFKEAKKILLDFLDKRVGDRVGLVVFGDRAYIASPLTSDISSIKVVIKALRAGVAGGRDTSLYEALYLGSKLFDNSKRLKSIILLTDGIDTIKDMPISVPINRLRSRDIRLYAVGVGNDYREDILKQLVGSNGRVFNAKSSKELKDIYKQINILQSSQSIKREVYTIEPLYRYTLSLALIFMLILFFRLSSASAKVLALSLFFALLALLFPNRYIDRVSNNSKAIAIILDISQNMRVKDIPPNRFEYAISRVKELIDDLDNSYNIALMAFDNRAYLISPPTKDKEVLKSKIEHLKIKLNQKPNAMIDAILYADKLLKGYRSSKIALFTSSKLDINQLDRVKKIDTPISIYAISTLKGGAIPKDDGSFLEDKNGVVLSYLDPNLADISSLSGGVFASFNQGVRAWREFKKSLISSSSLSLDSAEQNSREIIYILIILSIIFLLLSKAYPYIKADR